MKVGIWKDCRREEFGGTAARDERAVPFFVAMLLDAVDSPFLDSQTAAKILCGWDLYVRSC